MVEALRQQNEALQDSVQVLQTQSLQDGNIEDEPLDSHPLSEAIWDNQVPKNFKPPSMVSLLAMLAMDQPKSND